MNAEHVITPTDYFIHTLDRYDNWLFAWFRETAKNAADAGATQINYVATKNDSLTLLSVTDNGGGMTLDALKHDLLTLGGSSKKQLNISDCVMEYGYAKNMILFAQPSYHIRTSEFLVIGKGLSYMVEPMRYHQGTSITILVTQPISHLSRNCRILAREYQTDISITFNGKPLKQVKSSFDHQLKLPVGTFSFNETLTPDETDIRFWVKLNGLPLFYADLCNSGRFNIEGELSLDAAAATFLTADHEGFTFDFCQLLGAFFHELSHYGSALNSLMALAMYCIRR